MFSEKGEEKKKSSEWKDREIFSLLRTTIPFIVRIDGRNFKTILEKHSFSKPYDEEFARAMVNSAKKVIEELGAVFAYTFSDEVNFYFSTPIFNLRIEKINSVIPSLMASNLTIHLHSEFAISFDSRIIPIEKEMIAEYLKWRQDEAWRNHMNSYAFYTLLNETGDKKEVIKTLNGMKGKDIHDMLFKKGINLAKTPAWQRRGILIYRENYVKCIQNGNPVKRGRITENWDLPLFDSEEGRKLIKKIIFQQLPEQPS